MRTAPVPRVVPADPGLETVDSSGGRARLLAPSRGSVVALAGGAA
jgi:hypothetical protein